MAEDIRVATFDGPGSDPVIQTVPWPQVPEKAALIQIGACGVCGTDLHILKGEYGRLPIIPGHEFSGEVVELGKAVEELKLGDQVTVNPVGVGYGVSKEPGGFEDYVKVRASSAYPTGDLTYDEAALVEPLGCVVNGLDTVGVHLGDEVLVVGAGPIGLLLLQTAKFCGAQSVVVVDVAEEKLTKAKELGADEIFVASSDILASVGMLCCADDASVLQQKSVYARGFTPGSLQFVHEPAANLYSFAGDVAGVLRAEE